MSLYYLLISLSILWQYVESQEDTISGTLPPLVLKNYFCGMKPDDGSCKAIFSRYYFNIFTRQCELFEYGGCEGNENNFVTKEECEEKCVIQEPPVGSTPKKGRKKNPQVMPEFCSEENDSGICRGYISRYFYNTKSKKCEKFKYGGCLGNRNNFMTVEECQTTCENLANMAPQPQPEGRSGAETMSVSSVIPTAMSKLDYNGPSMCLAPVNRGNCNSKERRFYYDHLNGKCHPFVYTGCGGNENNFKSRRTCMKSCKKGTKHGRPATSMLRLRSKN
ncbi:tissue factor pathway inhibitor [Discoglossus pictus]